MNLFLVLGISVKFSFYHRRFDNINNSLVSLFLSLKSLARILYLYENANTFSQLELNGMQWLVQRYAMCAFRLFNKLILHTNVLGSV